MDSNDLMIKLQLAVLLIGAMLILPVHATAQGAKFGVTNYKTLRWTRVGKSSIDSLVFSNLDSVRRLHVRVVLFHSPQFSIVGSDSLDIAPLHQDNVKIRFSPTSSPSNDGDFRYVTDGTFGGDSTGLIYVGTTAMPVSDTLPWIYVNWPIDVSSSLDTFVDATMRIANLSDTARTLIGSVSILGRHGDFELIDLDSSFVIQPYDTAFFVFRYRPTSLGKHVDTILITSNGDIPNYKCFVSETALTALTSSLSSNSVDFGNVDVGKDSAQDIFYTNTSGRPSFLIAKYLPPRSPFYLLQNDLGLDSLTPEDTRTLSIDFQPTAPGNFNDSLVITSNATPSDRRLVVYLHGEASVSSVQSLQPLFAEVSSNPARNNIAVRITAQEQDQVTVELLNELGQSVRRISKLPLEAGLNRLSIPVFDLPRGEYFLRMSGRHSETFRVILQ